MSKTIISIISICVVLTTGANLSAQDAENVEQVGCTIPQWGTTSDVTVEGDLAYVAAGSTGLSIVNISDPENPHEVGYCDTPEDALGVVISDDLAFVAAGSSGLRIMNVSDPANPCEIGYCDTPGIAFGVAVSDGLAFVADWSDGLRVIDISDHENPREIGSSRARGYAHDVTVTGNLVSCHACNVV